MKAIVFGATGTVGRLFVQQALEDGHQVTAFARKPERLEIQEANLTMVSGDALNPVEVADAICGHDAVVVTLGAGLSRKSVVRSQGTANIIAGMKQHGVDRLICQSTLGAHESWNNLNFFWKRIMFGALLRPVFKDHELQENLVRRSGLDWTLVRPSAFTDETAKGAYKENFGTNERNLALKIPRADVAAFLKRQLSEAKYVNRAVSVSY